MGKPSAPAPPNYAAAATAQGAANVAGAEASNYLNQPNQVGPNGSLTYSYDTSKGNTLPDGTVIPQTTATTKLSPQQQALYDQNNQLSQSLNTLAQRGENFVDTATQNPLTAASVGPISINAPTAGAPVGSLNYSGVSAIPQAGNFGAQNDATTAAQYGQAVSRLDPQFKQSDAALTSSLANQGISAGSEAYTTAKDNAAFAKNDAYNQAGYSAQAAGNQEQQALLAQALASHSAGAQDVANQGTFANQAQQQGYNQGLAGSQFQNQAQQQTLQEADYFKNQPLNMLNALRSGNQTTMPTFGNVAAGAQVAAAPVFAAANDQYQAQLQQFQTQQSGTNALLSGLGALGGAAITKYSDRRLKEDLRRIGTTPGGLPLYSFKYLWDKATQHIGVLAQDAQKLFPEAVILDASGYYKVNYGGIR